MKVADTWCWGSGGLMPEDKAVPNYLEETTVYWYALNDAASPPSESAVVVAGVMAVTGFGRMKSRGPRG